MKGTIKIEITKTGAFSVESKITKPHLLDKVFILDALADRVFEMGEEEREIVGAIIALGGLKEIAGITPDTIELSGDALEFIRKMKGNEK